VFLCRCLLCLLLIAFLCSSILVLSSSLFSSLFSFSSSSSCL
jgi:hypothetical protein